jgi:hypothetical protein
MTPAAVRKFSGREPDENFIRSYLRQIELELVPLEYFPAKWRPVRVKKTRQNKNLDSPFDSIEAEKALVHILLEPTFLLEVPDEAHRLVG